MLTETPSACSVESAAGCSEAFAAELMETCGPIGSVPDVVARSVEDFAELVTRGKLARDFESCLEGGQ
jgi:hypothetical protein